MILAHPLILTFLILVMSLNCECQSQYFEKLSMTSDKYLNVSFVIPSEYLSINSWQIFKQQGITSIKIFYGLTQMNLYEEQSKGSGNVYILVEGAEKLEANTRELLTSIFSIQVPQRYSTTLGPNLVFIHSLHEKFCIHHLESLLSLLPCRDNSGLAQILDPSSFFKFYPQKEEKNKKNKQTKESEENEGNHYGAQISWGEFGMNISIWRRFGNGQMFRKVKIHPQCLNGSILQMTDYQGKTILPSEVAVTRIIDSLSAVEEQNELNNSKWIGQPRKQILGNWYNQEKEIHISLPIKRQSPKFLSCDENSNSNLCKNESKKLIIYREILFARATITNIEVKVNNEKVQTNYYCKVKSNVEEIKYKENTIICEIRVLIENHSSENGLKLGNLERENEDIVEIIIFLHTKLINFDLYETIFGGGTELPSLPVTLAWIDSQKDENHTEILYTVPVVPLKTPEPDESLPFQVITFVIGIYGYLWLAIWRKFSTDISEQKAKIEKKENEGEEIESPHPHSH